MKVNRNISCVTDTHHNADKFFGHIKLDLIAVSTQIKGFKSILL